MSAIVSGDPSVLINQNRPMSAWGVRQVPDKDAPTSTLTLRHLKLSLGNPCIVGRD
jgi:hypothetical protein